MKPSRMIFELKDKIITFGSYQVAVMFVQPQSKLIETYLHVKLAVSIRSHPVAPYKFIYIYKNSYSSFSSSVNAEVLLAEIHFSRFDIVNNHEIYQTSIIKPYMNILVFHQLTPTTVVSSCP